MIDHITLNVRDYEASKKFYTLALQPLGYQLCHEYLDGMKVCGWGIGDKTDFWIVESKTPSLHTHIALGAGNRKTVSEFYHAALKGGGKDNGAPGLRAIYHPNYFGAFVLDPDGNNIEAVCHQPE